jgi:predicted Zn-dependent protease with MMP-like domain
MNEALGSEPLVEIRARAHFNRPLRGGEIEAVDNVGELRPAGQQLEHAPLDALVIAGDLSSESDVVAAEELEHVETAGGDFHGHRLGERMEHETARVPGIAT